MMARTTGPVGRLVPPDDAAYEDARARAYAADQDLSDVYAGEDFTTHPADAAWARTLSEADLQYHEGWHRYHVEEGTPWANRSKWRALLAEIARRRDEAAARARMRRTA